MGASRCDACRRAHYLATTLNGRFDEKYVTKCWKDSQSHVSNVSSGPLEACCACPKGATCDEGSDIRTIQIDKGWYRHSKLSPQVLECEHENACPVSSSTDTGFGRNCSEKYAGALCASCANSHFRDLGSRKCVNCDRWQTGDLASNLVLLSLIIIIVGVQVYFTRQKLGDFIKRQKAKYLTLSNHSTMLCEFMGSSTPTKSNGQHLKSISTPTPNPNPISHPLSPPLTSPFPPPVIQW